MSNSEFEVMTSTQPNSQPNIQTPSPPLSKPPTPPTDASTLVFADPKPPEPPCLSCSLISAGTLSALTAGSFYKFKSTPKHGTVDRLGFGGLTVGFGLVGLSYLHDLWRNYIKNN